MLLRRSTGTPFGLTIDHGTPPPLSWWNGRCWWSSGWSHSCWFVNLWASQTRVAYPDMRPSVPIIPRDEWNNVHHRTFFTVFRKSIASPGLVDDGHHVGTVVWHRTTYPVDGGAECIKLTASLVYVTSLVNQGNWHTTDSTIHHSTIW